MLKNQKHVHHVLTKLFTNFKIKGQGKAWQDAFLGLFKPQVSVDLSERYARLQTLLASPSLKKHQLQFQNETTTGGAKHQVKPSSVVSGIMLSGRPAAAPRGPPPLAPVTWGTQTNPPCCSSRGLDAEEPPT